MSEIQLSPQLFQEIQQAVIKQSPDAGQDPGVMMQYLGAVTGYILGSQKMTRSDKDAFLDELVGFIGHVMDDTDRKMEAQKTAQTASAFGYWEPPKES